MPKMHYFQKSPSAGGSPPPMFLNLHYWWPEVTWFDQIVVFEADCDEIKLQKISYDVIFVTSSSLCQPNDVTKITSQNFSILALPPNQNFWLRQCVRKYKRFNQRL